MFFNLNMLFSLMYSMQELMMEMIEIQNKNEKMSIISVDIIIRYCLR